MGVDLIQSLLYGVRYFKENTFLIVLFVMLGFMALALLLAFVSRHKEPRKVFFFFFLVLIANIAGIFFLEMITGAQPPTGRKSIYLIPIIFCVFVAGLVTKFISPPIHAAIEDLTHQQIINDELTVQ